MTETHHVPCLTFSNIRKPYHPLSLFSPEFKVRLRPDLLLDSVGLAYEAARFPYRRDVQRRILACRFREETSAVVAEYAAFVRPDWHEVKDLVLDWCLRLKLAQHYRALGAVFREVGDRDIVYQATEDTELGARRVNGSGWRGSNTLGRLLTVLKEEFRSDQSPNILFSPLRLVDPPVVDDFLFLGAPVSTWKPGRPVER